MITIQDILNDEIILSNYAKIDAQNTYPFNHGLKHVKNVASIMQKLINSLNINENEANNLLITAILHDIGQVEGRINHGLKGRKFAEGYLKDKLKEDDLEKVLAAIEFHDQKVNQIDLPLFTNLVCFSDKMDFTSNRLEENYQEKFCYIAYENVEEVNFEIKDNYFILKINTDGKITAEDLLSEKIFFFKVITAVATLAKKLELQFKIYVDSQKLTNEQIEEAFNDAKKSVEKD